MTKKELDHKYYLAVKDTPEYKARRKAGFPDGFQTLCHNHQWKKELMRRREQREQNGKF